MVTKTPSLRARGILEELKRCGVSHIVWLPDSESTFMYDAIHNEPSLTLVPVCREGEAMAVAAGLLMGGKTPVVLIQNTGFFESGDSIRGICLDWKLPMLLMIGYRGYESKPMTDSAGIYLEPMLKTWGIPYHVIEEDSQVSRISQGFREAQSGPRPVAILIAREYDQP
ncbi:MAG: hypothetical protein HYY02_07980 [Chloroflexi bacterium]|nr:hypothetical protein [Chloroflexota bacterium]